LKFELEYFQEISLILVHGRLPTLLSLSALAGRHDVTTVTQRRDSGHLLLRRFRTNLHRDGRHPTSGEGYAC
jgi:hypothetical protein